MSRSRSEALLFAILFVLLLLGLWSWQGGSATAVPMAATSADAPSIAESAQEPEEPRQPVDASGTATGSVRQRVVVAELGGDLAQLELRVVDAVTGQPVPRALVGWVGDDTMRALQQDPSLRPMRWGWEREAETIASSISQTVAADEFGIAKVLLTTKSTVFARDPAGGRYGEISCDEHERSPPGGLELRVSAATDLEVRVLDHHGRPLPGMPVGFAEFDRKGALVGFRPLARLGVSRAPDGIATIRRVDGWRERQRAIPEGSLRVVAMVPGLLGEGAVLDFEQWKGEPLELRVPPFASMRIVFDPRVTAIPKDQQVVIRALQDGAGVSLRLTETMHDGVARFPFVPLDQPVSMQAAAMGAGLQVQVRTPAVAGADAEYVLGPRDDQVVRSGQLLDDHGAVLADTQVRFAMKCGGKETGGELRTDADGRFGALLGALRLAPEIDSFTIEVVGGGASGLRAVLDGGRLLAGERDLGVIRLGADPVMVAGQVRVDGVAARPDGENHIERWRESENGVDGEWVEWRRKALRIDSDGRFVLRTACEPGRYRLCVTGGDYQRLPPIEFQVGKKDLVVDLHRGSSFVVTAIVPDGFFGSLQATLHGASGVASEDAVVRVKGRENLSRRQQFVMSTLPDGDYRLSLWLPGFPDPLAVVDGVRVPGVARDARLRDIDLRERLLVQQLMVHDDRRQAMSQREVLLLASPLSEGGAVATLPYDTRGRRVVLPGPHSLMVGARGYRPQTVLGDGMPLTVVLERWPRVELVIDGVPALPDGWKVQFALKSPSSGDGRTFRGPAGMDQLRNLIAPPMVFAAPEDGRVSLSIGDEPHRLLARLVKGERKVDLALPELWVLPGPRSVAITLPAEPFEQAFAEVR